MRFIRTRKILNYLIFGNSERLFRIFAGENPLKEERIAYLATKINHIIMIAVVPITIFLLMIVLSRPVDKSYTVSEGSEIFFLYFMSFISFIFAFLIPKIFNWQSFSRTSMVGIFINHSVQTILFLLPVIFSYFAWKGGVNLFITLPLFTLSIIALSLTFPTIKRWQKWTNWTSILS